MKRQCSGMRCSNEGLLPWELYDPVNRERHVGRMWFCEPCHEKFRRTMPPDTKEKEGTP